MQLSYRGAFYEHIPHTVETVETSLNARFMGVNYRVRRPVNLSPQKPNLTLRYRGIPCIVE
ncbi:MAG TPA: DUF4278 domain-containing protein [Cyanobacteria bacterium UBA8803]|nr:DUF4278 domain-containing protein [Cyanobacteria bacterium UBA9273]HBL62804.1 DUF4278 domain-containing protein [Cyanobacteria bacterium UBA8803]